MANKKISELTAATAPAETDMMPIVQAASTKKATVSAWVRGALLTGLSTATNAAIAATDSVLVAIGKLQAQITGHIGNATNAHGMTTPGAAILQAATVADQRAAIGALAAASPASSGAWVHDGAAEIKGAAALHGNTALVASARLNIGDGALWKPGVQIGTSPYSGLYGPALTYLAAVASGGWVSTGGGTASALTVDEGYLSFATADGVAAGGAALSWTTRLRIDPSGRTQINGSFYLRDELRPVVDNNHSIGEATLRFATGYFATNPVIGSDARLKCDYSVIPGDIAHELMLKIVPRVGKFIVGGQEPYEVEEFTTNEAGEEVTQKVTRYREVPGKRYHTYYLAQEVKAALDAVADRWPQAANLALWLLSDVEDVDSIQMVRYEQMIPIIHAATVDQWQQK